LLQKFFWYGRVEGRFKDGLNSYLIVYLSDFLPTLPGRGSPLIVPTIGSDLAFGEW